VFDIFLPLDYRGDIVVMLGPDQPLRPIPAAEALDNSFAVLPNPAGKITGDLQRPVPPVGHHVQPTAHYRIVARREQLNKRPADGRVKPGHDGVIREEISGGGFCYDLSMSRRGVIRPCLLGSPHPAA
jgi:hypothetical protein